jgi:hypothetical protein
MTIGDTGPVHQAREDNASHEMTTGDARQGAVSGRVVTVLIVSLVVVGVIFAIMWLSHANLG